MILTPGLEVKEFDGSILRQMRNRFDEELDEKMDGQNCRFPGKVMVQNLPIELQPEQKIRTQVMLKK